MPRLPMAIIDECVVKRHTGEKQDQLLYLDIVRERQQLAFELGQESHLIAISKIQRPNTKLLAILHKLPNFEVGNYWVWIYNPQATAGQGVSDDSSHLATKLPLNWTGPYKILVVGPGLGPDGRPVADKTLYLDLPTDMPGKDQEKRVSVDLCKMCHNLSDDSGIPKYLTAGLSKYVLHSFTDKSPPFHPTAEDVVKSGIPVDIEKITGHQLVRGRGGKLAVMYETHWEGLSSITWELLAARTRVLDVNSKTSEGCKLQVPCHAQSPGTQSLLAPQEQVLPRTGIPSSVIQYLGKEIQRAASTASSLLLVGKPKVGGWDR